MSDAAEPPPTASGYVKVGGLEMYYEHHGSGAPRVLLHGAVGTIESCLPSCCPCSRTASTWWPLSCKVTATPATSIDR